MKFFEICAEVHPCWSSVTHPIAREFNPRIPALENRQWNIVTITKAEVYSNNTLQNRIYHKEINSIVDSFDRIMIFRKLFQKIRPILTLQSAEIWIEKMSDITDRVTVDGIRKSICDSIFVHLLWLGLYLILKKMTLKIFYMKDNTYHIEHM